MKPAIEDVVDDRAASALLQHLLKFVFQAQPRAFEIDVNRPVPVFLALLDDGHPVTLDAGVIEGVVQAAKSRDGFFHHSFDISCPRHVRPDENSFTTGSADQVNSFVSFLSRRPATTTRAPLLGEKDRCLASDARSSARYQCYLAFTLRHRDLHLPSGCW